MYALINCDVYTGSTMHHDKAVLIDGNRVATLLDIAELDPGIERKDLVGGAVAPGFIDIQVNGGGDVLFNDAPTAASIRKICEAHRRFGTTSLLPTFITGRHSEMVLAAAAVDEAFDDGTMAVLGIHYEGPWLSEHKAGVHDKRFLRPVNDADLDIVCARRKGRTIFTIAPEIVDAETIGKLCAQQVIVSLGHTNARYIDAMAAFDAGAKCTTHLYNAMSQLGSREPGVVGAALDHAKSWMGIIVDGVHADFAAVRVAVNAKRARKAILVTDAMPPVGGEVNRFRLGEWEIRVEDERCVTSDGVLAGSALDMATAVRNCVQKIGIPKDEALRMASTYAAELLQLDDQLGYVRPGYLANLVIMNNQMNVTATVAAGEFKET